MKNSLKINILESRFSFEIIKRQGKVKEKKNVALMVNVCDLICLYACNLHNQIAGLDFR